MKQDGFYDHSHWHLRFGYLGFLMSPGGFRRESQGFIRLVSTTGTLLGAPPPPRGHPPVGFLLGVDLHRLHPERAVYPHRGWDREGAGPLPSSLLRIRHLDTATTYRGPLIVRLSVSSPQRRETRKPLLPAKRTSPGRSDARVPVHPVREVLHALRQVRHH